MADPVSLNPTGELRAQFDFLYGEIDGYVYAPLKHSTEVDQHGRPKFTQHYFQWPADREALVRHCLMNSKHSEVYISPAMYRIPSGKKSDILGSNVVWTEFDGSLPTGEFDLPAPSMRVRSSGEGHEHWYWRLSEFSNDVDRIETTNRGITYALGGDTSAWDANQVLRPVATKNHKRESVVRTVSIGPSTLDLTATNSLPLPPVVVGEVDASTIPDVLNVIATHKFTQSDFEFFRKTEIPTGERSAAMMRLGFICAEMNLTDAEAYSLLINADDRWGKFKHRDDRPRRITDIINKARIKYPKDAPVVDAVSKLEVFGYQDFLSADIHVEWFIEGLLQRAGFLILVGPPGTGKTQISLQWAIHLALGRPFLGFEAGLPAKTMFFSMEMGHADLKHFVAQMDTPLTDEERALLQQNLLFIPTGYGLELDDIEQQKVVEELVDNHKPEGVFFDSLGMAATDDLSNESTVKAIMAWNARLRAKFDVFTWYIHHNRKAQVNNKKPNKLEDVFGSQYIVSNASTVVGLWPVADTIEVNALKVRLASPFSQFSIKRSDNISFVKVEAPTVIFKEKPEEKPNDPLFKL